MLFRKVLRDLKQNAVQFLAIFIMTMFAMFFVGGFDVQFYDDHVHSTQYFEETNYKDLDIKGAEFTYTQLDTVAQMDEVKSVNGILHGSGKTILDKERLLSIAYIWGNDVSKMKIIDGEPYHEGSTGVWLEKRFADPMGIKVGDYLSINTENVTIKEQVKGLVYSPEFIYYIPNDTYSEPEYGTHGFAIMDIGEAPVEEVFFDDLLVDLKAVKGQADSLTEDEKAYMLWMKNRISERLDDKNILITTKTEDENYSDYVTGGEATSILANAFSIIFLVVALLGIFTTMTRVTSNQRTQIGTMKALGFSKRAITIHYLSYSVVVAFIACICGIVIGRYTLGAYLIEINEYYYQNPYTAGGSQLTIRCLIMPLIAIAMCMGTSYVCTRKILNENAAEILRPEAPKNKSTGLLERTSIWEKLKFGSRWNIRDVDRNKLRTALSIFGIAVTSMLLFAAFGFYEALSGMSDWMYKDLLSANYMILFDEGTDYGVVSDYAKQYSGQMVETISVTVNSKSAQSVRPMMIIDEGNEYRFQNEDLEYIDLPDNGVVLTSRLKDTFSVDVGDELTWKLPGSNREYSSKIVGISRQAINQGIILSRNGWEALSGEFVPNTVYTDLTVPTNLKDKDGIIAVNDNDMMVQSLEAANEIGYTISVIISAVAVIMGIIVLYNLGVLSYIEKVREIATMKVLGFQSLNIRLILMQQNLTITIVGALIGIPIGNAALAGIVDAFLLDYNDVIVNVSLLPYFAAIVGTFFVSAVVNILVTSKVNDINMVEALKGVE